MVEKIEALSSDERFAFWQNELSRCIRCNACRDVCPACTCEHCIFDNPKSGASQKVAADSFEENMCGCCSSRCPAGISHPQVAELARRLNGKYIQPESKHLTERVEEIDEGKCEELIRNLMKKQLSEIKELYNSRDFE